MIRPIDECPPPLGLRSHRIPPRPLPRGNHGLSAAEVVQNQRERLIAGIAEAVHERGYAETSVTHVCGWAGVSRATFYEIFDGIRDCMLAAFAHLSGRLHEEVERAVAEAGEGARPIRAGVGRALELLAADPPAARLLTIEVLAAGPAGVRAQHGAFARFAVLFGGERTAGPPEASWALIALLSSLVAERLISGQAASLPVLLDRPGGLAPLFAAVGCDA